jgi:hypothetical protein
MKSEMVGDDIMIRGYSSLYKKYFLFSVIVGAELFRRISQLKSEMVGDDIMIRGYSSLYKKYFLFSVIVDGELFRRIPSDKYLHKKNNKLPICSPD